MEITKSEEKGEVKIAVRGCLDTAATPEFAAALQDVRDDQALLLDFSELEFIASSALRQLVSAKKKRGIAGGPIALVGLNDVVADVFDVTGLNGVFEIR